ncbi:MAG: class I SAM-dependent methyltransferase, partial [Chitinophagaceae bacterium]|nr:class I SAM-dependent methyltransferase [Chitinophagaceae bacterium]
MNNYAVRSQQTELIDQADIPFKDWSVCLKELNIINTWLGGHAITIKGVKNLFDRQDISIAEIGCGGGDNLKAINKWATKNGYIFSFTGIDINKACIDFAEKNCKEIKRSKFIVSDYRIAEFDDNIP